MRRFAALAILLGGVLGLACGCGYALVGSGLEGAGTIAIRTPENNTQEPGAEYVLADALRRELLRRSGTALTEDPERADLVVSGRVLRMSSHSRSFSSAVLAREHDLVLEVVLEAVRSDGTALLAGATNFQETERYLASADIEAERKNRDEALHRVSNLLAARFFDSIGESLP